MAYFFNKGSIEIYGCASTEDFNENKISSLQCKYSVWTEFNKHLICAFHNYLNKLIQSHYEEYDYHDYTCIQKLYEYNLTEYLGDYYIYNYLNKNIDIYRKALMRYNLYGIYCFYELTNNLDKKQLRQKTISLGNMYDICISFEIITEFISDVKSLQCIRTIQQIFKNYLSINKHTVIEIKYTEPYHYNNNCNNNGNNTVIII